VKVNAQFDTAGSVSGSLTVRVHTSSGTDCDSGPITFAGKVQPPA